MAEPDIEQLVGLARSGGRREVDVLLGTLRPLVARWALVWTGSPDLSEDVAQKVLVKVHRALPTYSAERGSAASWVYWITRNVLIDLERRRARDRRVQDRMALDLLVSEATREDPPGDDVLMALDRMMRELSPRQRAVFDLVDLQGFGAAEAAEMLDLAPATVRVHLHRARESLRAILVGLDSGSVQPKESIE